MKYLYVILFCFLCININAQKIHIKKVEVYALNYNTLYIAAVSKKDVKKNYSQYTISRDEIMIIKSGLEKYLNNMKLDSDQEYVPEDYRAIVIIHYSDKKKVTYYIASSFAGIVNKNNDVYEVDVDLIAGIYSFLPSSYFEDN